MSLSHRQMLARAFLPWLPFFGVCLRCTWKVLPPDAIAPDVRAEVEARRWCTSFWYPYQAHLPREEQGHLTTVCSLAGGAHFRSNCMNCLFTGY